MKKFILLLFILFSVNSHATTYTTNYNLTKPGVGDKGWGNAVNTNFDVIDTQMKANADATGDADSDSTWTDHNDYPSPCSAGQYVSGIGDTLTCGTPTDTDTTYSASGTLLDLTDTTFSVNEGTLTNGKLCTYVTGTGIECNTDDTDTDTTYSASGTLLDLTGTTFSINEGTLTDTKYCTYEAGTGIECNSEGGGGGSSQWSDGDSSAIYYNDGNVGIGTSEPNTKLHVRGGMSTAIIENTSTIFQTGVNLYLRSGGSNAKATSRLNSTLYNSAGTHTADLIFSSMTTNTVGTVYTNETMRIKGNTRNIGIGTSAPSARLHTLSTTEQLRLGYNTSNYVSTTVGSTGIVTHDAVGSGSSFVFSDPVKVTGTQTIIGTTNNCILTVDADATCDAGTKIGEDNSIALCMVCAAN
jgi:hypothetical protein